MNRHHWFAWDDWYVIIGRLHLAPTGRQDIWAPYNGHWATVPILVSRGLFKLFGVRTYLPYVTTLVLVHLTVVHLLWHLMRRAGVEPLIATALASVFALLGIGYKNLVLAWQIMFIAPLALGLAAALIAPEKGPLRRRDLAVALLLTIGVMCSSVGLLMVAVVGIGAFLRRGWKIAAATVSAPIAAYGVWFVAYRTEIAESNTDSLSTIRGHVPGRVGQLG